MRNLEWFVPASLRAIQILNQQRPHQALNMRCPAGGSAFSAARLTRSVLKVLVPCHSTGVLCICEARPF